MLIAEMRSLTQVLGVFEATFDHLAELTGRHADEVVAAAKAAALARRFLGAHGAIPGSPRGAGGEPPGRRRALSLPFRDRSETVQMRRVATPSAQDGSAPRVATARR